MLALPEVERDSIVMALSGISAPPAIGRNIANICDFLNQLSVILTPTPEANVEPAPVAEPEPAA